MAVFICETEVESTTYITGIDETGTQLWSHDIDSLGSVEYIHSVVGGAVIVVDEEATAVMYDFEGNELWSFTPEWGPVVGVGYDDEGHVFVGTYDVDANEFVIHRMSADEATEVMRSPIPSPEALAVSGDGQLFYVIFGGGNQTYFAAADSGGTLVFMVILDPTSDDITRAHLYRTPGQTVVAAAWTIEDGPDEVTSIGVMPGSGAEVVSPIWSQVLLPDGDVTALTANSTAMFLTHDADDEGDVISAWSLDAGERLWGTFVPATPPFETFVYGISADDNQVVVSYQELGIV